MLVHCLWQGVSLCRMKGVPGGWPDGHTWVRNTDWPPPEETLRKKNADLCKVCEAFYNAHKKPEGTRLEGADRILWLAREAQRVKLALTQSLDEKIRKPGKHPISCDSCTVGHCCKQLVLGCLFEGVLIAKELLDRDDFATLKALEKQAEEQYKMLEQTQDWETFTRMWFDQDRYCPLIQEGRCTVYGVRPVTCSAYYVVTDPGLCAPPTGGRVIGTINAHKELLQVMAIDGKFASKVMGTEEDLVVAQPILLGSAVGMGFKLLANGPESLKGMLMSPEEFRNTPMTSLMGMG